MRKLVITNSAQRDGTVSTATVPRAPSPRLGLPDREVSFRRYLAAAPGTLHEEMAETLGEEYGQKLLDGDPEVDAEQVGRFIGPTDVVYLSSEGEVLYASPEVVEILYDPSGEEREKRPPRDEPANVADESPVRWTGRKLPKGKAARTFAFKRTVQLRHVDGVTYDFLYSMAKELHEEGVVVLIGAGPKGKAPLIFQANGTPYRGFLDGRVDGEKYQLLIHLSNLELKVPVEEGK